MKEKVINLKDKQLKRGAGILLHISSLPSDYGIGTMGKVAYEFVDKLVEAGQKYWQVLPLGPTSYGDSPYQSFSAFAGNPYFIDLDMLCEEGLLNVDEVRNIKWCDIDCRVSYERLWDNRDKVLLEAFLKSRHRDLASYKQFETDNCYWLEDYALFMACKTHFNNEEWLKWDEDIRFRQPDALARYKIYLADQIDFWKFIQYKFYEQWSLLKKYANQKGISIIGDIPIYVALDSADIWVNPHLFQLDENRKPVHVAGCPPDAFSDEGQKWGNPLYDWKAMEIENFAWWRRRMTNSSRIYDVVRIDHFIGVVRYYSIPANGSAKHGFFSWGPGEKLVKAIDESIGDAKIIAEDLGVVVPEVGELLEKSGYPGMKVLEFAFDCNTENEHLPHNYTKNCVAYGGTHDNDTLMGYYSSLDIKNMAYAMKYADSASEGNLIDKVFIMAYRSVANTVIFQMQDILKKDNSARMNYPSTIGSNWRWRLTEGEFDTEHINKLSNLVAIYGR